MSGSDICMRPARPDDLSRLEAIRSAAFAPVFRSFRQILGDSIYSTAQAHEDAGQRGLLEEMFSEKSVWSLYVAQSADRIVGFVSLRLDHERSIGEIGLNAVDPAVSGQGIGTKMYQFAVDEMRSAGMKVATVSTGGDPSHQPALGAYRKAGFNVEISSVWLCRDLQGQE